MSDQEKRMIVCAGGLAGAGTTLVATFLSATLYPDAVRIRLTPPDNATQGRDGHRSGGLGFQPHLVVDPGNPNQRSRLHETLANAEAGTTYLVDAAAGDPANTHNPAIEAFHDFEALEDFEVELVVVITPDLKSVERARTTTMAFWSPQVRVTAVFNHYPEALAADRTDWQSLWTGSSIRKHLHRYGRAREIQLPIYSERLADQLLDDDRRAVPAGASGGVVSMDAVRWERAAADFVERFTGRGQFRSDA